MLTDGIIRHPPIAADPSGGVFVVLDGWTRTICFALSGHRYFDLGGCDDFLAGRLDAR